MAYSDFTEEMLFDLGIKKITTDNTIFKGEPRSLIPLYEELLEIGFRKSLRTELDKEVRLIIPFVEESIDYLTSKNKLGGIDFQARLEAPLNVDKEKSLNGFVDLMVVPGEYTLKKPILTVVEAKKGLMDEHTPQLVAELYSMLLINKTQISYGILTDGIKWEFFTLSSDGICKKTPLKLLDYENTSSWEMIAGLTSELLERSYLEVGKEI